MIVIGIDSSSKSGACAVLKDGELVADGFINNGLTHSQTLMPLIKETIDKANINISNVDLFAVTKGPGSFTGLRIGMSTVKGLAAQSNAPCIGISTLQAIAEGSKDFEGIVCAVMDARCQQVYNALFEASDGKICRICDDRALSMEDLKCELIKINQPIILVGDGAKLCYNNFSELENIVLANEDALLIHGESVARIGETMKSLAAPPNMLNPVYLRLPQAQRELLAKHKKL